MGQTADQLRQEVDHKREDAAEKLDQIETKVEGAAQQVKDTLDLRSQIEQKPLMAAGIALVGGFVLGGLMGGDSGSPERHTSSRHFEGQTAPGYAGASGASQGGGMMDSIRKAAKNAGLDDTINTMAATFMGTITDQLKRVADQNMPGFADKFQQAQHTSGSFKEKAQAAQDAEPQRSSGSLTYPGGSSYPASDASDSAVNG